MRAEEGIAPCLEGVTEHRRDQARLARIAQALRTLSECNQTLVRATNEATLLADVCRIAVELGGYRMAWVGYKQDDEKKSVQPVASAGFDEGYTDLALTSWDDSPRGRGPTGKAIRSGEPAIARFILTDPDFAPWRQEAVRRGFASSIALPLVADGAAFGMIEIYAVEPDAFDDDEVALLEELAHDLAFGITTIRLRHARELAETRVAHLNAALRGILGVSQLIVRERNRATLIRKSCELLVESRGLDGCCAILVHQGKLALAAHAGAEERACRLDEVLARGQIPGCVSQVLGGVDLVVRDTPTEMCQSCPMHEDQATARDTVAVRLACDRKTYGALLVSLPAGMACDAEEQSLLLQVAGDIAFALRSIEMEEDQARSAEEVRRNEALFRSLVETAPIAALASRGMNQEIEYLSRRFTELFGYTLDDIPAVSRWWPLAYPDEASRREVSELWKRRTEEAFRNRTEIAPLETKVHCKDGSVRHVEFRLASIDELNLVFCTDLTERRQAEDALRVSEHRFRTLIEQAPVAIAISRNGRAIYANPMCLRLFGYDSAREMNGLPLSGHIAPQGEITRRVREAAQGLAVPHEYDAICSRRDGTAFHARVVVREVQLADGEADIGFLTDITEQRRIEEQLRQSQKMEAVGRLAGGIAHDFNNVMTVVNSFADLALADLHPNEPLYDDLNEIRMAGERAATLTRQLLAFSRKQLLQPETLNLNEALAGIEGMLRRLIGEDIELVVSRAADLGNVRADPVQIQQVLMNLAVNSRDAMPGGGKLTIETANVELDEEYAAAHGIDSGPHVMLSVADTGCGMDEQTLSRIFEPFFTTKEHGKGTGLGLATVYGIVKQSGGSISVYSEPGRGATFEIYLPRELTASEAESRARPAVTPATGTETVLVVEDEGAVRNLAKRILSAAGYSVLTAAGGDEALAVCERRKEPVHLVLTDVVMPQMSGRELAERLTKAYPDIAVLYMSGYADNAISRDGVCDPGTHFIAKPFTTADLTRKIREVLDGRPPSTTPADGP